jgi:hypothetical protein
LANSINWIFLLIFFVAFGYWMKQIRFYAEDESENASHSM